MTDYPPPAEAEGPDEIDPKFLATGVKMELLLKNPASYIMAEDTNVKIWLVPDKKFLEWSDVPLIADPANCEHCFSACAECSDSWGIDYYIRVFVMYEGEWKMVWMTPDHPDNPFPPEDGNSPPLYNIN